MQQSGWHNGWLAVEGKHYGNHDTSSVNPKPPVFKSTAGCVRGRKGCCQDSEGQLFACRQYARWVGRPSETNDTHTLVQLAVQARGEGGDPLV